MRNEGHQPRHLTTTDLIEILMHASMMQPSEKQQQVLRDALQALVQLAKAEQLADLERAAMENEDEYEYEGEDDSDFLEQDVIIYEWLH
jgi:hypothetical protein